MSLESRLRLVETRAHTSPHSDTDTAALNAFRRVQAYLRRRLRLAIAGEPDAEEPCRLLGFWEANWWYRAGMLSSGGHAPEWDDDRFFADLEELADYCERSGGLPTGDSFDAWLPSWSLAQEWQRPPSLPWHAVSTCRVANHFRAAMLRDPVLGPLALAEKAG